MAQIPARSYTRVEFAVDYRLISRVFPRAPEEKRRKTFLIYVFLLFFIIFQRRFFFGLSLLPPQKARTRMASSLNVIEFVYLIIYLF